MAGSSTTRKDSTLLFCLDSFSPKAKEASFYIEKLPAHLKKHDFISQPHKHDFYLLLYITKGKGYHTIDFKTYPLRAGSFFLMTPGQVHSWKLDPGTDGYIIFFMKEFYQLNLNENSLIEFPFFHSLNANPLIQLKKDSMIDSIVEEMFSEFQTIFSAVDLRILRGYLDLLLLKLSRQYPLVEPVAKAQQISAVSFKLRKLEELIEKNYRSVKQPSEYAERMNISASYLNTLCKQHLGKTLSDLINERIILEARRIFAYSDMTVNQVADLLNFSSSSYFIRFFKKHTGHTPESTRIQ